MIRAEKKSLQQALLEGWKSTINGKPDRLDWKIQDGRVVVVFTEVKGVDDHLHGDQFEYLTLLTLSGLNVRVWYEWGDSGFYKDWKDTEEFQHTKQKILPEGL